MKFRSRWRGLSIALFCVSLGCVFFLSPNSSQIRLENASRLVLQIDLKRQFLESEAARSQINFLGSDRVTTVVVKGQQATCELYASFPPQQFLLSLRSADSRSRFYGRGQFRQRQGQWLGKVEHWDRLVLGDSHSSVPASPKSPAQHWLSPEVVFPGAEWLGRREYLRTKNPDLVPEASKARQLP